MAEAAAARALRADSLSMGPQAAPNPGARRANSVSMGPPAAPNPGARRAPVAITGIGAVTALGFGVDAIWRALVEGADGIRPIERFSTEGFSVHTAGMVPLSAPAPGAVTGKKTADHALDYALAAAAEAGRSARLHERGADPSRVAIVFGTSLATHPEGIHRLAEITGDAVGARGPRVTISTACSSSANAIGYGRDLLLAGVADVVIAGGSDALTEEIFAGFHNLGLLSPDKCAPFSEPPGTTLGEGAGFVVLEREERGGTTLGWVSGYGLSCDAHHATSPDPTGAGVARAARAALADAGLTAADVDYVNAHGTGTENNDPAEWRGILAVLGERASRVPVSATKSVFGHGQGAAGVLELIATLLAMRHGAVPQTLHHTRPRPRCPADPVAQRTPRPHPVAHALCNSSAFGGANAVVAIDAAERPVPARSAARRPVWILGAGLVVPGASDAASLASLGAGAPLVGPLPAGFVPHLNTGVDLRGFDPLSRYLTFATAGAVRDAGAVLRGLARDRMGIFAALTRISPASAHELDDSVKQRGLLRLSAPAFTRVVLNASTGACARALQLRGPTTTITTGDGGGLTALVMAAEHLALRDDADVLCAAAADEIDRDESPERWCEAAACLVLGAGDATTWAVRPAVCLAGWGLAGPGERALAIARALASAGIEGAAAPDVEAGAPTIPAPAAHPLLRAAVAIHRLRAGERDVRQSLPRTSVLLAHDSPSCATAVIFSVIVAPSPPRNTTS
jgi:3-oxoacyl-[acyl-carrier-protein] synthase II